MPTRLRAACVLGLAALLKPQVALRLDEDEVGGEDVLSQDGDATFNDALQQLEDAGHHKWDSLEIGRREDEQARRIVNKEAYWLRDEALRRAQQARVALAESKAKTKSAKNEVFADCRRQRKADAVAKQADKKLQAARLSAEKKLAKAKTAAKNFKNLQKDAAQLSSVSTTPPAVKAATKQFFDPAEQRAEKKADERNEAQLKATFAAAAAADKAITAASAAEQFRKVSAQLPAKEDATFAAGAEKIMTQIHAAHEASLVAQAAFEDKENFRLKADSALRQVAAQSQQRVADLRQQRAALACDKSKEDNARAAAEITGAAGMAQAEAMAQAAEHKDDVATESQKKAVSSTKVKVAKTLDEMRRVSDVAREADAAARKASSAAEAAKMKELLARAELRMTINDHLAQHVDSAREAAAMQRKWEFKELSEVSKSSLDKARTVQEAAASEKELEIEALSRAKGAKSAAEQKEAAAKAALVESKNELLSVQQATLRAEKQAALATRAQTNALTVATQEAARSAKARNRASAAEKVATAAAREGNRELEAEADCEKARASHDERVAWEAKEKLLDDAELSRRSRLQASEALVQLQEKQKDGCLEVKRHKQEEQAAKSAAQTAEAELQSANARACAQQEALQAARRAEELVPKIPKDAANVYPCPEAEALLKMAQMSPQEQADYNAQLARAQASMEVAKTEKARAEVSQAQEKLASQLHLAQLAKAKADRSALLADAAW